MPGLKENLDCPRRMAVFAVFDIIDKLGGEYEKALAGDITAKVNVLGKTSEYAFAVTEVTSQTSILHISLLRAIERLTEKEKQLAIRYLMDCVLYYLDQVQASGKDKSRTG